MITWAHIIVYISIGVVLSILWIVYEIKNYRGPDHPIPFIEKSRVLERIMMVILFGWVSWSVILAAAVVAVLLSTLQWLIESWLS